MNGLTEPSDELELSPDGQTRRKQMLHELQQQMQRVHTRRAMLRKCAVAVGLAVVVTAAVALLVIDRRPNGQLAIRPSLEVHSVGSEPGEMRTPADSGASGSRVQFELIDDNQLLTMLKQVGQPAELARIDGRLVLLPIRERSRLVPGNFRQN